jgi:hypothetical protein
MISWDEEIEANLFSGQPERIAQGIHELKLRVADVDEWEIAPLAVDILDSFDAVPIEVQEDFLYILLNHTLFSPPLTEEQRIHRMITLVVRYGNREIAYKVALELKVNPNSPAVAGIAMQEALRQGNVTEHSLKGVRWFTSCLLDGKVAVRNTTLATLLAWKDDSFTRKVISYILPSLTEAEREPFADAQMEPDGLPSIQN